MAVLCVLHKLKCNPMHHLYGDLPVPYVPVRVTRGAVLEHRYTYSLPRCRTSQYSITFSTFSVSLWNDLDDPAYSMVGYSRIFKSRSMLFFIGLRLGPFLSSNVFPFSSFFL